MTTSRSIPVDALPHPRLSEEQQREYHAIRAALMLAMGVVLASVHPPSERVMPQDRQEQTAWLQGRLSELAKHAPSIATAIKILDARPRRSDPIRANWIDGLIMGVRFDVDRLACQMRASALDRRRCRGTA